VTPREDLKSRVETALASLQHPRLGHDVMTAGVVRECVVDDDGHVLDHERAGE
jgi:hypothetical protein